MRSLRILLLFGIIGSISGQVSLNDRLDEKLKQTKIELAKLYLRQDPPAQRKVYAKWDPSGIGPSLLILNKQRPFIINAFDKILLIKENRFIMYISGDSSSNRTSTQEIIPNVNHGPIKFIRNIVWRNTLYLLVCYEIGTCGVYTGTNNLQLKQRQTIEFKGYPMDASFFVRANRLYLVVADNSGPHYVPSLIYHWRGTYMSVIDEAMTIGAVSVTTFEYKQSTIIVFAQYGIGSMVYKFKESVRLHKIQLLSTFNPIAVYQYSHTGVNFILLMNEIGPSTLFWWDGLEFLNWQQVSEIRMPSVVHIAKIDGDTLFFVGHGEVLQLYKFENASDCALINTMRLPSGKSLIDVRTRINESTIIIVLVTMNPNHVYSVEQWELIIEELPSVNSPKENEILLKQFAELVETLQQRKPLIEQAEASWPRLLPANENLTISEPLVVPNLKLDSGIVENIDIVVDEDSIIAPTELEERLEKLIPEVDTVLKISEELSTSTKNNSFTGNINFTGDAFIEQLEIDKIHVNYLNGIDIRPDSLTNLNKTQQPLTALKDKDVIVENLKVDSVCGIPFKHWALKNVTSKMAIDPGESRVEFSNDTVRFDTSVSLTNLNIKTLNGMNVNEFFNDLFIINRNQKIKGNVTYNKTLHVSNLTTNTLNGEPWDNYMNKVTNQRFDEFVIKKFVVENLYAGSINDVPVSEAARTSTENVVKDVVLVRNERCMLVELEFMSGISLTHEMDKIIVSLKIFFTGNVTIAKLHVKNKFVAESDLKLSDYPSHQLYSNVVIQGNVKIGTLDLDKYSKIIVNGREINLMNVTDKFWTKSTDQVIHDDVVFENKLVIDHLKTKCLNGSLDEEFLYTTTTVIPESFKDLHFENVRVDGMFFIPGGENDGFYDIAPESVTIRERLHLKHLHGNQLLNNVYNGLFVADILSGKQPSIFPRHASFSAIRAEQLNVEELNFLFFNGQDRVSFFESATNYSKGDRKTKFMRASKFDVTNLRVERLNDIDMKEFESLMDLEPTGLKNLVIHGDLTVNNDLKFDRIDDQSSVTYLENMAKEITIFSHETIDELIVENVTFQSLNGRDPNDLFDSFFSKSRKQNITGRFSFYNIITDNVQTGCINGQDVSKLMWIDQPVSLNGNVTFEDLFVDGDVTTNTLNYRDINEIYENMRNVSVSEIANLRVDGNVFWDIPSTSRDSLTYLLENAVINATNQTIEGEIIFESDVSASTVFGQWKGIEDIRNIISDAVINDGDDIEIVGEKIFRNDLKIDTLAVTDNIDIPTVNNIDVLEFNQSVARKDRNETIEGRITFLNKVVVNKILVDDRVHNIPLKGVVLATDMLPPQVVFKDLVILKDLYVKNLDGINFDEFLKNRVTLDGDHDIFADVHFSSPVEIMGNANVSQINGIDISDLIINGTTETQIISGSKIFEEDTVVYGNIHAPFINKVNISSEYAKGVRNNEDVEIFGDLLFESKVKVIENVTVSGAVNNINLHTILHDLEDETHRTLKAIKRNETKIEESISRSKQIKQTLRNIFSYLEPEEELQIRAPNVKKVDVVYYEQITKLNMFGEEPGPLCGLPDGCSCPTEFVAELTDSDCHIQKMNSTNIIRNYHELHSTFGVNVISNTVSYSPLCSVNDTEKEFTKISWMKTETINTGDHLANVREISMIRGFISDASAFITHHDTHAAFIVLAVYYDPLLKTHNTESLIFKIDLEKNVMSLHQNLSADGARVIEVFEMNHREMYLVLGCFGESKKSFLYKLDPHSSLFKDVRSFGGKTSNVKSLHEENDHFILLDDFDTNAMNIFHYDEEFDNFYDYQTIFHDSRINGIECFYANEFGRSDSFVIVTTEDDQFYIYEYMFAEKFKVRVHHRMDDLQTMVPFHHMGNHYIITGTLANTTILRIVKQGPH